MATELPRMGKTVARVIVLENDAAGGVRPVTIYDQGKKRTKKQSAGVKLVGKAISQLHDAQARFDQSYVARHKKSNTKRRDGWLRDVPLNVIKAGQKARRKLKIV